MVRSRAVDRAAYIARGLASVPGWFDKDDASIWSYLDEIQAAEGVAGDLFEIGPYMGRSAILLGYFRRASERLVVCDLFGRDPGDAANAAENAQQYPTLDEQQFRANYRRFHPADPEVIVGSSLDVTPEQLGGPFRFAHIDGSHLYAPARSDTLLCKKVASPAGLIVFDDARHELPVIAAAWEAVANDGLVPILQTRKLYAAWTAEAAAMYVEALGERLSQDPRFFVEDREVRGHRFLEMTYFEGRSRRDRLRQNLVPRGIERLLDRARTP